MSERNDRDEILARFEGLEKGMRDVKTLLVVVVFALLLILWGVVPWVRDTMLLLLLGALVSGICYGVWWLFRGAIMLRERSLSGEDGFGGVSPPSAPAASGSAEQRHEAQ